jgi:hypothetical protein
MVDEDRDAAEFVQDPAVRRALAALGSRLPDDPCPRCMEALIAPNSPHGFCQPCTTAQPEQVEVCP